MKLLKYMLIGSLTVILCVAAFIVTTVGYFLFKEWLTEQYGKAVGDVITATMALLVAGAICGAFAWWWNEA